MTNATLPPKEWPQTTSSAESGTPACTSLVWNHELCKLGSKSKWNFMTVKTHIHRSITSIFWEKKPSNVSNTSSAQDSKLCGEEPKSLAAWPRALKNKGATWCHMVTWCHCCLTFFTRSLLDLRSQVQNPFHSIPFDPLNLSLFSLLKLPFGILWCFQLLT